MSSGPAHVLSTYVARPGSEDALRGVLRTHVARLRELGLVADRPSFCAERKDRPGTFIESFWWANEGAAEQAHAHSEVQELWMRVEDLCGAEGMTFVDLVPLG